VAPARIRGTIAAAGAGLALLALLAAGCASSSPDGAEVERVDTGNALERPTALAFRPNHPGELWVTNQGGDSITIVGGADGDAPTTVTRQDGYAEHFVARPSGIAFDRTGAYFAVSNDSTNDVRDMTFRLNPERNRHFKNNNFMGPTLFNANTYARAGQSKRYLDDWPQPGWGHDPPDDVQRHECPDRYWSTEAQACRWPREGSHLDMLHGDPRSAGIAHNFTNQFFLLDGCGSRTAKNRCRGDGHVTLVDFNRDHQEGNGFHGDGVLHRYIDAPFKRVAGTGSGIALHDGWVYYSDTGNGVLRRLRPQSGRTDVMVGSWHAGGATHGAHGPGVIDWSDVPDAPPDGDGDAPPSIDRWIAEHGDQRLIKAAGEKWIKPQETLGEYAYVRDADLEEVPGTGDVKQPVGLAIGDGRLFVGDRSDGRIHEIELDGMRVVGTHDTGLKGLSGVTYRSAEDGGALYVTDTETDGVYRLDLDD
jgi:hypothetical protein